MRRLSLSLLCVWTVLAAACASRDDRQSDTSTTSIEAAPAPAAGPLAHAAGRWAVRVTDEHGDSLTAFSLHATPDTSGWTMTLAGRPPMPVAVSVSGDSIITEAGPYESILQPGVQVLMRSATRIEGDRMIGSERAIFRTAAGDSVVMLRLDGRRTP